MARFRRGRTRRDQWSGFDTARRQHWRAGLRARPQRRDWQWDSDRLSGGARGGGRHGAGPWRRGLGMRVIGAKTRGLRAGRFPGGMGKRLGSLRMLILQPVGSGRCLDEACDKWVVCGKGGCCMQGGKLGSQPGIGCGDDCGFCFLIGGNCWVVAMRACNGEPLVLAHGVMWRGSVMEVCLRMVDSNRGACPGRRMV